MDNFEVGDLVGIYRARGGRPCRGKFTIRYAGLAGGDGYRHYLIRPASGGEDRVVHQAELVRFNQDNATIVRSQDIDILHHSIE